MIREEFHNLPIENRADREPNASLRECQDCIFMRAAVTWWCSNREAIHERRTAMASDCRYWKPAAFYTVEIQPVKRMSFWGRLGELILQKGAKRQDGKQDYRTGRLRRFDS